MAKTVSVKKKTTKKPTVKSAKKTTPPEQTSDVTGSLVTLRDEIDRLVDRFSEGWPRLSPFFDRPWPELFSDIERRFPIPHFERTARADVTETDEGFEITVELPGMTEKDIELTLTDDALTLKGEKSEEREEKKKDYHMTERTHGSIQRTFRVPSGVDRNKVNANFSNGLLKVTLPKTKAAKAKKRQIRVKGE